MRHFFLIIMIVLMPLRGWAGDVMGMKMATQQMVVASKAAHSADFLSSKSEPSTPTAAVSHADCKGQMPEISDMSADDHCSTCTACQACFSAALVVPMTVLTFHSVAHSVPVNRGTSFASADIALGQKPPIS